MPRIDAVFPLWRPLIIFFFINPPKIFVVKVKTKKFKWDFFFIIHKINSSISPPSLGLLKRNAADRLSFEQLFSHPFLSPLPPPPLHNSPPSGLPVTLSPEDSTDDFVLVPSSADVVSTSPPRPSSLLLSPVSHDQYHHSALSGVGV